MTAIVEMAAYDSEVGDFYRALLDDIAGNLRNVIDQGQAGESIRATPAAGQAVRSLTWMVERTLQETLQERSGPPRPTRTTSWSKHSPTSSGTRSTSSRPARPEPFGLFLLPSRDAHVHPTEWIGLYPLPSDCDQTSD